MKKRLIWLFVVMMFIGTSNTLQAQVVVETDPVETDYDDADEEDEEDDDDLEDDETDVVPLGEDEFAVTDGEGNEEVVEFPEAMTYDLDSLLNLYMSKTYLSGDNDCQMSDVNPVFSKEEYVECLQIAGCCIG